MHRESGSYEFMRIGSRPLGPMAICGLGASTFVAGALLHSQILPAVVSLLAVRALLVSIDRTTSHHPFRAALACIAIGTGSMFASLILGLAITATAFDLWTIGGDHSLLVASLLTIAFAALRVGRQDDSTVDAVVLAAGLGVLLMVGPGRHALEWAATAAAALLLAHVGWQLMHRTASDILRSGQDY